MFCKLRGIILYDQFSINRTQMVWNVFLSFVLRFVVTAKMFQCKFIVTNSGMPGCTIKNVILPYFFQI